MFHTPPPFERRDDEVVSVKKSSSRAYTDVVSDAIYGAMEVNPQVVVLTAAMCEGNKLQKIRTVFPDRFFDTGICEGHAVAFAAGHGQGGHAPHRRYLQHVSAAQFRPDLPGSGAAEPAGHFLSRPRGRRRGRRSDASRRVRQHLHAGLSEHGRHGARATSTTSKAMLDFALEHSPARCRSAIPKTAAETRRAGRSNRSVWGRPKCSTGAATAC